MNLCNNTRKLKGLKYQNQLSYEVPKLQISMKVSDRKMGLTFGSINSSESKYPLKAKIKTKN